MEVLNMRKKLKKVAAIALSCLMAAGAMTGCGSSKAGIGTKTNDGNKVLFQYDGEKVTLKEGWLYAKLIAAQYESTYSSTYGKDFWNMDMGRDNNGKEQTFESYTKQQIISQLKQQVVLNKKAAGYGCKLTVADKKKCTEAALSYYQSESGRKVMDECGLLREDVEKLYQEITLASKVKDKIKSQAKATVTEDEARKSTVYRVVFATTMTKDGMVQLMNKKEESAVKKKAQKALKEIQSGKKTIKKIAKEQGYTNTDESYAAGESEEGKSFEKEMKKLKDGDLCSKVLKCDNGYVIAKLVAYTDKKETASNKKTLKEEKESKYFQKVYEKWTKKLDKKWSYEKNVDQKLWKQVKLNDADDSSEATTDVKKQTKNKTTEKQKTN